MSPVGKANTEKRSGRVSVAVLKTEGARQGMEFESTPSPPLNHVTTEVLAHRSGVYSPAPFTQSGAGVARVAHTHEAEGCDHLPLQPIRRVQVRTGWCRRMAVNHLLIGKRFDSVHSPPLMRVYLSGREAPCQGDDASSILATRSNRST